MLAPITPLKERKADPKKPMSRRSAGSVLCSILPSRLPTLVCQPRRQAASGRARPSERRLDPKNTLDHGDASAAEDDAVAGEAAVDVAAAAARLEGGEAVAAEPFGPERRQRGMGGAGDRILVDAPGRHEDAADDVVPLSSPPAR